MRVGRLERREQSVRVRQLETATPDATPWRLPWPLMAVLAAVVTAAAGWLLVAGFCVLGWISVPQIRLPVVLELGTQGWLLAHGISVALPGARLSIMPLGLTLLIIVAGLGAIQQAVIHSHPPQHGQVGVRVARMGLTFGLTYFVLLGGARGWTEGDRVGAASLLGAIVVVFGLGLLASARAYGWRPAWLPVWARAVGLSIGAAVAVLIAGGAAALATALIRGSDRVTMIHDALQPGNLGGVMLLFGQLAWLPNFILWCGSWVAGAGVQLGVGTVVSPAQSMVGMLPSIPVFGAVPPAGPMPQAGMAWLACSVAAGVVAAYVMVRRLRRDLPAQTGRLGLIQLSILGALAGIVAGLAFTMLQLPASGDLGSVRLVDVGARVGALAIMAPSTMGLAGMATAATMGWLEARRAAQQPAPAPAEEDVPTSVVATRRPTGDE